MDFLTDWTFTTPTSYRLASAAIQGGNHVRRMVETVPILRDTAVVHLLNDHESHPNFGHLTLLVFEAVLEVVVVALPGYVVARRGMFDAEAQKMMANMNVQIFTPCLGMCLLFPCLFLSIVAHFLYLNQKDPSHFQKLIITSLH